jgi:FK506-binding protein 1
LVDRVPAFSSGIPFETEIGVGKVIKGWDEGELNVIHVFSPGLLMVIARSGVKKLSVGEKAKLTCTPDFVCSLLAFAPFL